MAYNFSSREIPLNARQTTISFTVGDGIEQGVCAIDGTSLTAHAFITHCGLDCGAGDGVDQSDSTSTIRVAIGLSAHEGIRESDGELRFSVDVPPTGT